MHWKVTTIIVGIQQTLDNHVLTVQLELKANKLQIIYSRAKLVQPNGNQQGVTLINYTKLPREFVFSQHSIRARSLLVWRDTRPFQPPCIVRLCLA